MNTADEIRGMIGVLRSIADVAEFFHAIDWARTLQINASFGDMSFRRKEDRRQFPNALEFGLKKGLKLPPEKRTKEQSAALLLRSPCVDLDWFAAVDQHHENLDGTGYPVGLKGSDISPEARVLRVADALDFRREQRVESVSCAVDKRKTLTIAAAASAVIRKSPARARPHSALPSDRSMLTAYAAISATMRTATTLATIRGCRRA